MLVILVGNSCTGKTSLKEELLRQGYCAIEASDYIRRAYELKKVNKKEIKLPTNILAMKMILDEYRESLYHAVLTGVRTPSETEFLQKHLKSVLIVAIRADYKKCYERAQKRGRDHFDSFEEFMKRSIASDLQLGLDKLSNMADLTITNNGNCMSAFLEDGISALLPFILK